METDNSGMVDRGQHLCFPLRGSTDQFLDRVLKSVPGGKEDAALLATAELFQELVFASVHNILLTRILAVNWDG